MRGERYSSGPSAASLSTYAELVCRGGWPSALNMSTRQAMLVASGYIEAVASSDVSRVDGVRRDSLKVMRVIASLARNESTLATNRTILTDLPGEGVADSTLRDYLDALRRIFFIEEIPAWSPVLRSPVKIRSSAKRHLCDPSLAAAAIGATPKALLADLKTLGFLFESLAAHVRRLAVALPRRRPRVRRDRLDALRRLGGLRDKTGLRPGRFRRDVALRSRAQDGRPRRATACRQGGRRGRRRIRLRAPRRRPGGSPGQAGGAGAALRRWAARANNIHFIRGAATKAQLGDFRRGEMYVIPSFSRDLHTLSAVDDGA